MDNKKTTFETVNYLVKRCYDCAECPGSHVHSDSCRSSGLRLRTTEVMSTHSRDAGNMRSILILEGLVYSNTAWHAIMTMPASSTTISAHEQIELGLHRMLNADATEAIERYGKDHRMCTACLSWVLLTNTTHACEPLTNSPNWPTTGILCPRCGTQVRAGVGMSVCDNCNYWSSDNAGGI
jgi:hypothetical protein